MAEGLTTNELVVLSDLMSRMLLSGRLGTRFNGQRDYYANFGYPAGVLTFDEYYAWYRRGGLAKRIIDLPCKATWKQPPVILDDENPKSDNEFEQQWESLNTRLGVIARLCRADILQSIGYYSVMLLGTTDKQDLQMPLNDGQFNRPEDLVYLQPISEANAQVVQVEADPLNARYGQPLLYNISLGQGLQGATQSVTRTIPVHYTRVIHFAEGVLEDDVVGIPRLEAVINLFIDLLKVSGGGAETYWLNAVNKLKIETNEGHAINPAMMPDLQNKLADFIHNLSSELILQGMKGERMGVQVADPTGNYNILMDQIAGTIGIPRRKLTGSERGELASSQDEDNFAQFVMERESTFAEPDMLRKTIDRFIRLGILIEPTNGEYKVEWAHPNEPTDLEYADLALKRAQAASAYVAGSAETIMTIGEMRESMNLDPEKPDDPQAEEVALPENNPQVQDQFQQGRQAA